MVRIKNAKAVKQPMGFRLLSRPMEPTSASAVGARRRPSTDAGVHGPAGTRTPHPSPPASASKRRPHAFLSVWEPIPPPGFVSLGCVVSVSGGEGERALQPPPSSVVCLARPSVTLTHVRDCVAWSSRR